MIKSKHNTTVGHECSCEVCGATMEKPVRQPFLTYGPMRLLNLPGAKAVYDEVLVEDCYRREHVPKGAIVLDVGGFYGEFGIWCAVEKKCYVHIFEPSPSSFEIAKINCDLNNCEADVSACAIGRTFEVRSFSYQENNPTNSQFSLCGINVNCSTLPDEVACAKLLHDDLIVVKLDCEGAEREIFEDESWLKDVHMVMLEFHNKDGPLYREILARHGFELDTTDPNPEAVRAIIYAKRKT